VDGLYNLFNHLNHIKIITDTLLEDPVFLDNVIKSFGVRYLYSHLCLLLDFMKLGSDEQKLKCYPVIEDRCERAASSIIKFDPHDDDNPLKNCAFFLIEALSFLGHDRGSSFVSRNLSQVQLAELFDSPNSIIAGFALEVLFKFYLSTATVKDVACWAGKIKEHALVDVLNFLRILSSSWLVNLSLEKNLELLTKLQPLFDLLFQVDCLMPVRREAGFLLTEWMAHNLAHERGSDAGILTLIKNLLGEGVDRLDQLRKPAETTNSLHWHRAKIIAFLLCYNLGGEQPFTLCITKGTNRLSGDAVLMMKLLLEDWTLKSILLPMVPVLAQALATLIQQDTEEGNGERLVLWGLFLPSFKGATSKLTSIELPVWLDGMRIILSAFMRFNREAVHDIRSLFLSDDLSPEESQHQLALTLYAVESSSASVPATICGAGAAAGSSG
jgi:hypothetical protein